MSAINFPLRISPSVPSSNGVPIRNTDSTSYTAQVLNEKQQQSDNKGSLKLIKMNKKNLNLITAPVSYLQDSKKAELVQQLEDEKWKEKRLQLFSCFIVLEETNKI
jgi:hypothetical protein